MKQMRCCGAVMPAVVSHLTCVVCAVAQASMDTSVQKAEQRVIATMVERDLAFAGGTLPFFTATFTTSSSFRRLCTTEVGSCELLSAPEPAFDLTSLPGDGFDGNTDGLESRPSDGEEQDWMQAFEAAEDMAARAREQTSRSRWTSRDYSDLGVSWALEEERAEQAAEAAEYARRVVEMAEEEEGEGEEEDEAYGDPEAEALLRECVLDEILRRVGCPRELRVQLAQGGAPWLRLAGSRWWDRVVAAGFFLEDSDPGLSGGSWHDVGDGLRCVDPWGCASALREGVDGVLGPARVEFWPWRLTGWSRWRRRQSLAGVRPLARVRARAAAARRRSAREPPPRARPREPCASAPL